MPQGHRQGERLANYLEQQRVSPEDLSVFLEVKKIRNHVVHGGDIRWNPRHFPDEFKKMNQRHLKLAIETTLRIIEKITDPHDFREFFTTNNEYYKKAVIIIEDIKIAVGEILNTKLSKKLLPPHVPHILRTNIHLLLESLCARIANRPTPIASEDTANELLTALLENIESHLEPMKTTERLSPLRDISKSIDVVDYFLNSSYFWLAPPRHLIACAKLLLEQHRSEAECSDPTFRSKIADALGKNLPAKLDTVDCNLSFWDQGVPLEIAAACVDLLTHMPVNDPRNPSISPLDIVHAFRTGIVYQDQRGLIYPSCIEHLLNASSDDEPLRARTIGLINEIYPREKLASLIFLALKKTHNPDSNRKFAREIMQKFSRVDDVLQDVDNARKL